MSKGNVYRQQVLAWALQGKAPTWAKQRQLYIALHASEPFETQDESESVYDGYSRMAVDRAEASFSLDDNLDAAIASLLREVRFPECESGTAKIAYWSVGTSSGANSVILYKAKLELETDIKAPMQPYFAAGSLHVLES
jgi:hypothetical protein